MASTSTLTLTLTAEGFLITQQQQHAGPSTSTSTPPPYNIPSSSTSSTRTRRRRRRSRKASPQQAHSIAASLPQPTPPSSSSSSTLLSTHLNTETSSSGVGLAFSPPPIPALAHPCVLTPNAFHLKPDCLNPSAQHIQRTHKIAHLLTQAASKSQHQQPVLSPSTSTSSIPTAKAKSTPAPAWTGPPRTWAQLAAAKHHPSQPTSSTSPSPAPSSPLLARSSQPQGSSSSSTGPTSPTFSASSASRANAAANTRKSFRTMLDDAGTTFQAPLTHPRGLINQGNMCFANAILQVLVYCAPFFNLFTLIGQSIPQDLANRNPLVEAVVQFLREFHLVQPSSLLPSIADEALLPELIYSAMRHNRRFEAMLKHGHQEDAEEFLGFFLDTLHEELLSAMGRWEAKLDPPLPPRVNGSAGTGVNGHRHQGVNGLYARSEASASISSRAPSVLDGDDNEGEGEEDEEREIQRPRDPTSAAEDDGWMEVGTKGRTSFTRTTSTSESPITRIFGGKLRSVLRVPGAKDSATLEPYQALQLVIDEPHVHTIEDALLNLTTPECLSDLAGPRGTKVDGTKTVFVETLPPVLVVHLKRFYYDEVGGVGKIMKKVGYGTTLEIRDDVLSPTRRGGGVKTKRRYKLFGVVYHHGRYATGGHYTVDVLRQDGGEWIHIDDTVYYHVPVEFVSLSAAEVVGSSASAGGTGTSTPAAKVDGGMGVGSPAHLHASLPNGQVGSGVPVSSVNGGAGVGAGVKGSTRRRHDGLAYLLFYRRDDLV
ncbi:hypothetical protein CF319_g1566 [Tilletia indica]|nr:hypothetical protein CF319_g1566 [Tilletia indica]